VMFTLDDSKSMLSDAIPDFVSDTAGMPTNSGSAAVSGWGARFPNMWGSSSTYLSVNLYKSSNAVARYLRSSAGNPLYYNRNVTYRPWPLATDDTTYNANATATAVNIHGTSPFNTTRQLNITAQLPAGCTPAQDENSCYWPATYYVYTGTTPLPLENPSTTLNVSTNFTKVEIRPDVTTYARPQKTITVGGVPTIVPADGRTDCASTTACTYSEELQNFANWLQYYRSRMLMAKGGIAMAFAKQGTNMRVGFTTINTVGNMLQGVAKFAGARRTSFYNELYARPDENVGGGTPLRRAMDDVGKYFQRSNAGNPWAEDPTSGVVGTEYTCRKSFHILSTDGYWNGAAASVTGDHDTFSGSTPTRWDGKTYSYSDTATSDPNDPLVGRFTINPFSDSSHSNTLADIAAYYWKTDLRTDLANKVPSSTRDPAFWQHLTTFTVGLGIEGTGTVTKTDGSFADLSTQAARDQLVADKTGLNWTAPTDNDPRTGDDLIHAAMNTRGRYFPATNPTTLSNGLISALSEVVDQGFDMASLSTDAAQVISGGKVYQATFSPSKWYGRLYAFTQDATTGAVNNKPTTASEPNPTQAWEASNKMPAPDLRNIFTYSGTAGSTFTWAGLNTTQQGHLNGDPTLLDYLRGSATNEVANGGTFRDRSRYTVGAVTGGVLGDVVNGSPVKGPERGAGYDRLPSSDAGKALYATFRSSSGPLGNMTQTMFLGANDGMLHAFNTNDGVERFAYVPNAVYNVSRSTATGVDEQKLKMLADPLYTHRFTVDGPPNVSDAFIGGAWKTILMGSNGAGARGIFAMNVTNPEVGGAAIQFGTGKIMWEFTEANNSDMGFVTAYPHVGRMRDGTWVAILGNGYDSYNGRAKLFILNLATGAVIKEFAVGAPGDNGLSQPNFLLNDNREVLAVYAGDLKGNLWKFDVSDTDPANWKVAFGSAPNYTPLFVAGPTQPITVMPEISAHKPHTDTPMIIFGTGKLFEVSDTAATGNVNLNTQALYGVWDKPGESGGITVAQLLQQTAHPSIVPPAGYGATSTNGTPNWAGGQRGWYHNLNSGGERVNISPHQVRETLFMVANKPASDPCASGGTARIFALNPVTGEPPPYAVFDTNNNSTFETSETGINVKLNATGVLTQPVFQLTIGAVSNATIGIGVSPYAALDRGQTSAARAGGVELRLSGSASTSDCKWLMTVAQSDTGLMSQYLQTCAPGKARISWRQLK
jgi:type IV pilus assembly protein PilY1